jgi:hypothetical protein
MKNACLIIIALLFSGLSLSANAAVTASLDRTQTGAGEAVQLTLQYDGQTDKQPDLSALKQDFDILGRSTGTSIQVINGKMSAQTQLSLTLMPKHGGRITIPPVSWNGQSSAALTLTVGGNVAAQPGNTAGNGNSTPANTTHAFITESLDQKQPYVQAAAMLTVRLYVDEPLYQATLELQPNNDVLIQQLGKDTQTSTTYRGRDYQVVERKYLLFPQRSGVIQLSGPVLNAQIADASNSGSDPFGNDPFFANAFGHNPFGNMINATRPIRLQSDPITLNVRPRPAASTGQDWLPAQNVTLTETWQPDSGAFHVGDPITRHLHLQAQGLTASQLPDLSKLMTLPDGLRAYPDQAKLNDDVQSGSVLGTRDQDIALIASRAGRYDIPAMHLHWWDTAKNVQSSIDLPARTLNVLPGATAAGAPAPPSQQSADATQASGTPLLHMANPLPAAPTGYLWPMTSLGLAVLWLGTLAAWWRSSRRNAAPRPVRRQEPALNTPPDANQSRKAFQQACRENDAQSARRHLLAWARAVWPDNPPAGLKAIATRLPGQNMEQLLQQLDRACYANGEWQGSDLQEALSSLSAKSESATRTEPQLTSLYP